MTDTFDIDHIAAAAYEWAISNALSNFSPPPSPPKPWAELSPVMKDHWRGMVGAALAAAQLPSFTCPDCGRTSYHPMDIANAYCGACHKFHPDSPPSRPASVPDSPHGPRQ